LPITKFDEITIGIPHTTIVDYRIGLILRFPNQQAFSAGFLNQLIHSLAAFQREAEMGEVVINLISPRSAGQQDHDKFFSDFDPRF
jgi:hypothetical protein